jgi:hypothetical protein
MSGIVCNKNAYDTFLEQPSSSTPNVKTYLKPKHSRKPKRSKQDTIHTMRNVRCDKEHVISQSESVALNEDNFTRSPPSGIGDDFGDQKHELFTLRSSDLKVY